MSVKQELEAYVNDEDKFIADVARLVSECTDQYLAGLLQEHEYDELMENLLSMKKIDACLEDEAQKALAVKAFTIIRSIIGFLPKL